MAITAYTGLMGAGKSYGTVAEVILPHAQAGRVIWTNIPLIEDAWRKILGPAGKMPVQFETAAVMENPRWFLDVLPFGALLVLDEAKDVWPAGLKQNQLNPAHVEYLTKHRHMVGADGKTSDVVLVTQDLGQISSAVRNLVEFTFRVVKLSVVGAPKKYRVDVYQGAVSGPRPPDSARVRQIFGTYKQEIFTLYRSHTLSATGGAGEEIKTDRRANVFSSALLKIGFPAAVLGLGWGIFSALDFFSGGSALQSVSRTAAPAVQTVQATQRPVQASQTVGQSALRPTGATAAIVSTPVGEAIRWSTAWRLTGFMEGGGRAWAYVQSVNGYLRRVPKSRCRNVYGDWQCEVDGFIVTSYTGQPLQSAGVPDGGNTYAAQTVAPQPASASSGASSGSGEGADE